MSWYGFVCVCKWFEISNVSRRALKNVFIIQSCICELTCPYFLLLFLLTKSCLLTSETLKSTKRKENELPRILSTGKKPLLTFFFQFFFQTSYLLVLFLHSWDQSICAILYSSIFYFYDYIKVTSKLLLKQLLLTDNTSCLQRSFFSF